MHKLITAYRTDPSLKLAEKIRAHAAAYRMSAVLLNAADADLMAEAIHRANREG